MSLQLKVVCEAEILVIPQASLEPFSIRNELGTILAKTMFPIKFPPLSIGPNCFILILTEVVEPTVNVAVSDCTEFGAGKF